MPRYQTFDILCGFCEKTNVGFEADSRWDAEQILKARGWQRQWSLINTSRFPHIGIGRIWICPECQRK